MLGRWMYSNPVRVYPNRLPSDPKSQFHARFHKRIRNRRDFCGKLRCYRWYCCTLFIRLVHDQRSDNGRYWRCIFSSDPPSHQRVDKCKRWVQQLSTAITM